jgi:hypothetical protein
VTLAFLEKVTLRPEELSPEDGRTLGAAGVSDQAVKEALMVCFCFNLIDRLADAFGWHVQTQEEFAADARTLLKRGYQLMGPIRKRALAAP